MKTSRLFIEKIRLDGCEEYKFIQSSTDPSTNYLLIKKDNHWSCDCIAGRMNKECKHIKQVIESTNEDKRCFSCGITWWAAGGLDQHHVLRRSMRPDLKEDPKNLMWLCRKCHTRATNEIKFEEQLQKSWQIYKNLREGKLL